MILSGTSSEEHLLENIRSLEKPPLAPELRVKLSELFRGLDDVSGQ